MSYAKSDSQIQSKGVDADIQEIDLHKQAPRDTGDNDLELKHDRSSVEIGGVAMIEAAQSIWGKNGKIIIWVGVALLRTVYELDNTTVYVYQSYAPSTFNALSQKATLSTACTMVAVVAGPPIAKVSDIIGRAWVLTATLLCYLFSYILVSASQNFATYAVGLVFYTIAQTGTNIITDLIVSDVSNARWRTLAVNVQFLPFLIMPWISALIVDSVINGIGWRWGVGLLAFIMPPVGSIIAGLLFYYQRKAKKMGIVSTKKVGFYEFFSLIDGGGLFLLVVGFAMTFLPISLASTTPSNWHTGWIIALIVIGISLLLVLPVYERIFARHPLLPTRYFGNPSIVLAACIYFLDSLCFAASHTYLYSWVVVAKDFGVTKATFYIYVNGVVQCLVGIVIGLVVYKLRRYKWVLVGGACIRTIGYGLMVLLRGQNNSTAEIFIVQAVQGIGDGIVAPICLTAAQIAVPHVETGQITAIILMFSILGSGVGSSIAGGIYTNKFIPALRSHLGGSSADETIVQSVYNSIASAALPDWGTPQRIAANAAYSDVIRYISIAALCCSAPLVILACFLPDRYLTEKQNLVEDDGTDVNEGAADTNQWNMRTMMKSS